MNCTKHISQCYMDDVITFDKSIPNHIKPLQFTGHLVGITHYPDGQVWLLGFKEKPFEEAFANSDNTWVKPTTFSQHIKDYTYFWYMQEDKPVEVLLEDKVVEVLLSEPQETKPPVEELSTVLVEENGTSTVVPCMTFQCAVCKRDHIAVEKDDRGCFLIPTTLTTSAAKVDLPDIGKTKGQYYFHCKNYCP